MARVDAAQGDRRPLGFRLSVALGGALVAALLRLLGATWRVREAGRDPLAHGDRVVGALWHQGLLLAAWRFRGRGVAVPVSRSRDGDRIVAVLDRLGYAPSPRGSSSRGGAAALVGAIRAARRGHSLAVLADGPRGPALAAKPGVVALARATRLPIQPVGLAARPAIRFGSWDRTLLPLPFARVAVVFADPLTVPPDTPRDQLDAHLQSLETRLTATQTQAETLAAT